MLSKRLADLASQCLSQGLAESLGRIGLRMAGWDWLAWRGVVLLLELVSSFSLALIFSAASCLTAMRSFFFCRYLFSEVASRYSRMRFSMRLSLRCTVLMVLLLGLCSRYYLSIRLFVWLLFSFRCFCCCRCCRFWFTISQKSNYEPEFKSSQRGQPWLTFYSTIFNFYSMSSANPSFSGSLGCSRFMYYSGRTWLAESLMLGKRGGVLRISALLRALPREKGFYILGSLQLESCSLMVCILLSANSDSTSVSAIEQQGKLYNFYPNSHQTTQPLISTIALHQNQGIMRQGSKGWKGGVVGYNKCNIFGNRQMHEDNKIPVSLDAQRVGQNKKIMKSLAEGQCILMSSTVIKINHVNKRQQRVLAITNLHVLNIASPTSLLPNRIKRKIPLTHILGITTSRFGSEVVIHVDKEDDYRFFTHNLKVKYIEVIVTAISKALHQPTQVFYYDDLSLEQFTTTVVDIDKKVRKTSRCVPVLLDEEKLKKNEVSKPESVLLFRGSNDQCVQKFEQFQIIKVLGRGAFGKVMLCKNRNNGQYYAVKSMRKEHLVEKETIQRTKTERYLLEKANHPFLVNLEYAFQSKEKIFLVMKFYRGGEMFGRIRKELRFNENRAKFYAAQIFLAIDELHKMGYAYRDLKPENILFDMNGYIKVSDYGLSKQIPAGGKSYSITGTPSYLSPQMIRKQGHSMTVDWWTLGVFIYEMIFSIPPFYHKDHRTMFTSIAFNNLKFPDKIAATPECKSLIQGLLAKDPSMRLGSDNSKEIKNHPWFKDMDWEALLAMKIVPEFVPEVVSDEDVSNFHENFTKEEPIDTIIKTDETILQKFEKEFQGFDYQKLDKLEGNNPQAFMKRYNTTSF